MDWFVEMLAKFLAVTIVLTLHEFAHAFVAYKCGDPTAKWAGRMSLNPARHFDPLGLVCFVFVGFGWAKPVPINENNFKNYTKGCALTSAAGVVTNYLSAFLFYPLFILAIRFQFSANAVTYGHEFLYYLTELSFYVFAEFLRINLRLFIPLDGFRIVEAASKRRGGFYRFLRQYGYYYFNRTDRGKLSLRNVFSAHKPTDFFVSRSARLLSCQVCYGNFCKADHGAVGGLYFVEFCAARRGERLKALKLL